MGRPKGSMNKGPLTEMQKLAKKIGSDGEDIVSELESFDVEGLEKRIAQSAQSISETTAQLKANPEYEQIVNDKKLLESGLKKVKQRQNAIIKVCLQLRKDRGVA